MLLHIKRVKWSLAVYFHKCSDESLSKRVIEDEKKCKYVTALLHEHFFGGTCIIQIIDIGQVINGCRPICNK